MLKKINKRSIFYFILAALIIYILFLDNSSFLQRLKYHLRVKKIERDMENLRTENEQLTKENAALKNDPDVIEEKARELGMQKENEEVFIFKEEDSD
jgi:cell division protein FtsB